MLLIYTFYRSVTKILFFPFKAIRSLSVFLLNFSEKSFWILIDRLIFLAFTLFLKRDKYPKSRRKIVSLVSHEDLPAYYVMINSLTYFSKLNFNYWVLDDGTLSKLDKLSLKRQGINVFKSNQKVDWQSLKYAGLKQRFPNQEIIYLDSDIIFFSKPKRLLSSENVLFMEDYKSKYSLSKEEVNYFLDLQPVENVNVGILKLSTSMLDSKLYNKISKLLENISYSRDVDDYYIEQTVYSVLFSKLKKTRKIKPLNKQYFLYARHILNSEKIPKNIVCIHFTKTFDRQRRMSNLQILWKTRFFTSPSSLFKKMAKFSEKKTNIPSLLTLLFLISLSTFISYKTAYFIAENYFFDKFFYQKSIAHGYLAPNVSGDLTKYKKRSEDIILLEENWTRMKSEKDLFQYPKDKNDFIVAMIGDSYLWGTGVKFDDSVSQILEKKLNTIKSSQVFSFAESGNSILNYLATYYKVKQTSNIDLYIFVLADNDLLISKNNPGTDTDVSAKLLEKCKLEYPKDDVVIEPYWRELSDREKRENIKLDWENIFNEANLSSWKNPINLCAFNSALDSLPTEKAIYFITDNYSQNNKYWDQYRNSLQQKSKHILSSTLGNNIPEYKQFWKDPLKFFQVSKKEVHPSEIAHEMYAQIILNELISNPKWKFTR